MVTVKFAKELLFPIVLKFVLKNNGQISALNILII